MAQVTTPLPADREGLGESPDPVVMRINGKDVLRSEFEYKYNKNNTDGVIDKKTVDEYVDLFINYKLKVEAALDARLDTLSSYQKEFREYRDQQIRPLLVSPAAEEQEVRNYYDRTACRPARTSQPLLPRPPRTMAQRSVAASSGG